MSRPSGPTSPLSLNSNDSGYQSRFDGPTLSSAIYGGGPYAAARPPQTSPPSSQHPSGSTDMSRPSAAGSSVGRPPSSASSIGQQSSYGRASGAMSGRPPMPGESRKETEEALQRHFGVLKVYLASSLQDEMGNIKPNRARDKLLRLSPTQFMELSTDVYDELIRREDDRLQRVPNVPRSLPPKSMFHPKRNQARQKLSTLPLDRFRQLATDVFYELQRRIPRIAAGEMDRPGSSMSMQSRGGMRPPGGGFRPPGGRPPPGGYGGYPASPGFAPGARPPQQKTFQSSTIIPNKGTMVEDDDDDEEADEDEDAFGLDRVMSGFGDRNADRKRLEDQELEIAQLRQQVDRLEREASSNKGSGDWSALREELEQKHLDAQKLNESLRRELDQLHKDKAQDEREVRAQHDRSLEDLRAQLDNMHNQTEDLQAQLDNHRAENEDLRAQVDRGHGHSASQGENEKRIQILETELSTQEKLTNEVRDEAMMYLKEMKELSRQNDHAIEQEEKLAAQVTKLEKETNDWRQRYARVKAQNKSLRASTMGLSLQTTSFDAGSLFRKDTLISDSGLVKDVDVTRFQLSLAELIQIARQPASQPMLDTVKNVILTVQSITSSIGTDGYPTPSHSPLSPENTNPPVAKLKTRVTGSANALITATKHHSSSLGLSPVALLDAAASNLSVAVVDLVKAVGIRPSPQSEFQDLDVAEPLGHTSMSSFYDDTASPNEPESHSLRSSEDHDNQRLHPSTYMNGSSAPHLAIQVQPPNENTYGGPSTSTSSSSLMNDPGDASRPKPAPLNLGGLNRSNTMKKWFGWGGGQGEGPNGSVTPIASTPMTAGMGNLEDGEAF